MRHTVTIHCISMWALSFTHALSNTRQLRALRLRPLSQLYFLLRHASAHPARLFSQRRIRTLHLPHRTRTSTAQRERERERERDARTDPSRRLLHLRVHRRRRVLVAPRVCTSPAAAASLSEGSTGLIGGLKSKRESTYSPRERERERERERRETLAPIQAAASFTCASTGVAASLLRHASAPHPPPPLLSTRVVQGSSVVSRASGRARIRPERERQREKRER
jgi:hypothetical protein